jgi:hypothetical protein
MRRKVFTATPEVEATGHSAGPSIGKRMSTSLGARKPLQEHVLADWRKYSFRLTPLYLQMGAGSGTTSSVGAGDGSHEIGGLKSMKDRVDNVLSWRNEKVRDRVKYVTSNKMPKHAANLATVSLAQSATVTYNVVWGEGAKRSEYQINVHREYAQ